MSHVGECKYFKLVSGRLVCESCGEPSPRQREMDTKMTGPGEDKTLKPVAENKAVRQGRSRR